MIILLKSGMRST